MSVYPPPTENLPIFNRVVFTSPVLTEGEADGRYLKLEAQSNEDMNNKGILDINRLVFNDGTTQTTAYTGVVAGGVPIGSILPFAGAGTIPTGYLLCDGSPLFSGDQPALFAIIGQLYGTGVSPSTDFNLPDMTSSFIIGNATSTGTKTGGSLTITNANIALTSIQARSTTPAEGNPNSLTAVAFASPSGANDWQYMKGQPSGNSSVNYWFPFSTSSGKAGGNIMDTFRTDIGQAIPTPINPVPLSYSMVYIIRSV
jgi:microcystin-dependent protein